MKKEMKRESRHAFTFGSGTMFSRLLGFVRDMMVFHIIPTASVDAFWYAFRFPNMLRDLVGEGASNAAFVPVFSTALEKESKERFQELVSAAMSAMLILLALLTVLGVLAVPLFPRLLDSLEPITGVSAPQDDQVDLMASLTRWTFPYLFFIGMAVFMMGALFTVGHYVTPSWSPALLNISLIAGCLLLRDRFSDPAYALVTGVWLGGIAQLAVQYIAFGRHTGVWRPNFHLRHPEIWTICTLMGPVILGQAAGEINKLVDLSFAAALPKGTVSALFGANRLVQLPLSVFGIATSVAILPSVSRAAAGNNFQEVRTLLMGGFRQTYFLLLPAMLGLIILAPPLTRLYAGRTELAAQMSTAVVLYGLGLVSFGGIKVAVSGFYAVKNTKTPVIIASASMFLNILLNAALVRPLGFKGLALATTISFTVNFVFLYAFLCERVGPVWNREFLIAMARISVAGLMMAAFTYGVYVRCNRYFDGNVLACITLPMGVAILTYGVMGLALDIPELQFILARIRRRRS